MEDKDVEIFLRDVTFYLDMFETNAVLMMGYRLRRWSTIKTILGQCVVSVGYVQRAREF